MSDFLPPHGLQHTRLPYPLLSPGVCSNSCLLSQWCHPTISSSVTFFSSCSESFPASGSFLVSQLCASGGQSIGASASASVFPTNIQGWFPLGLIGLISLLSKGLSRVFSRTIAWKHQFFSAQPSLWLLSCPYMTSGKTIALTIQTFVCKVMALVPGWKLDMIKAALYPLLGHFQGHFQGHCLWPWTVVDRKNLPNRQSNEWYHWSCTL